MRHHFRVAAAVAALCACASIAPAAAGAAPQTAVSQPNRPPADYLKALRTANTFAWAWAHRDATAGLTVLTPALRAKAGAREFFIGTSTPANYAFEVTNGRAAGAKTYRFDIKLFVFIANGDGLEQSTKPVPLMLTQAADGAWYVSAFPVLAP